MFDAVAYRFVGYLEVSIGQRRFLTKTRLAAINPVLLPSGCILGQQRLDQRPQRTSRSDNMSVTAEHHAPRIWH
ncbi:hypothetical protein ACTWPB_25800 [Nocardia sp. IBHARD005]|uniref:hypothetical protein n=1 Tax=Nocardia sp. IBHARD005 TaxID=3457765 RepID=UPI0040597F99